MNMHVPTNTAFDLADHARGYVYDRAKFAPLYGAVLREIEEYHPNEYGLYLANHSRRVAEGVHGLLIHQGYERDIAQKISDSMLAHDVAKTVQDIAIWRRTADKPSKEITAERLQHATLGPTAIKAVMKKIGFEPASEDDMKHLQTMFYIAQKHHERPDGKGPAGLTEHQICPALRAIITVDTIDGKLKAELGNTLSEAFDDMAADRNKGRYFPEMTKEYRAFLEKQGESARLPSTAQGLHF